VPRFLIDELIVDLESHIEGAVSHGKRPEEAIRSAKEWAMDQAEDCRKLPQWKDRTLSLSFLIFNPLKRKGFLSFGDYWLLCAGMLVGVLSPLRSIEEGSPALVEWSWVHSLTLIIAAVAVGVADHRRDPTRLSPTVPAITQSPGLIPTDEASSKRKRKCDWVALGSALWPTLWFTAIWSLTPPDVRDAVGLWLVLSVFWLLLLAYLELVGKHDTRTLLAPEPGNPHEV